LQVTKYWLQNITLTQITISPVVKPKKNPQTPCKHWDKNLKISLSKQGYFFSYEKLMPKQGCKL